MSIKKNIAAASIALLCAGTVSLSASADTITTAVSVGVKYYQTDTKYDDFATNATYASNAFGSISTCTNSSCITSPTAIQLREALKSNVVFLNSHASANSMTFKYKFGTTLRDFDIRSSSNNSSDVSLSDIDLSNVKLMQFFGCNTAASSTSLAHTAYSKGVDTSIGFRGEISTRTTTGRKWVKAYLDALKDGYNVTQACSLASTKYPNTTIEDNFLIIGYPFLTIASSSRSNLKYDMPSSLSSISEFDVSQMNLTKDTAYCLATTIDSTITPEEYTCTFTYFNDEKTAGAISFVYKIGENITTNKCLTFSIENGEITNVFSNNLDKEISNDAVINKYNQLGSVASSMLVNPLSTSIINEDESYFYDCTTGKVYYSYITYTENEDGSIVDNVYEIEL